MQTKPIAATIIALAESLGLGIIAEGVETDDQRLVLANLGCHLYQGFCLADLPRLTLLRAQCEAFNMLLSKWQCGYRSATLMNLLNG